MPVALLLAGWTLTGCSGDDGGSCADPTAMPATARPAVGDTIRVERLGTVVAGQQAEGFATMTIESELSIDDLQRRLPASLTRLDMKPLSVENEGFEAEIYFGGPGSAYGVARVTESTLCTGRTTIVLSLSDERLTAAG